MKSGPEVPGPTRDLPDFRFDIVLFAAYPAFIIT